MLEHATFQTAERVGGRSIAGLDAQVAHLFEAMAQMEYHPAEELMRQYIPKNPIYGYYSRGAAIWALGHLRAEADDEPLAAQLAERMNDTAPINPDLDIVFKMSALSLGRMRAESQLEAMRSRLDRTAPGDPVCYAIRWSLHEITGEVIPDPDPVGVGRLGWFLEPIPDDPPDEPPAE
jgi:hypothetical protein